MRIASCNIRTSTAKDNDNDWVYRKDFCLDVLKSLSAEILCLQEVSAEQFIDLRDGLADFAFYGMSLEPCTRRPVNCIFYREDCFSQVAAGGYWLSETPHVPGSVSWDSKCVRLANWVRLEEKASQKEFRMVNTHLDHVGQVARENQARLILEDTTAYPDEYPQFLTGDMNCDFTNKAIGMFQDAGWKDTYNAIHGTADPGTTFHAFIGDRHKHNVGKMDFVLVRGAVQIKGADIIKTSRDGKFPSDHFFVTGDVQL